MRPINKGSSPQQYNKYGDAKNDLIERIGCYCSYCERSLPKSSNAVEHVIPKNPFPLYELEWNNFLLACINCNSIKGDNGITPENINDYLLPHIYNTFKYIDYTNGIVKVKENIPTDFAEKAKNIIELTGLDRIPGHSKLSDSDDRWYKRKEAWENAIKFKTEYDKNPSIIYLIKMYVTDSACPGTWSIFMNVFKNNIDVIRMLIDDFKVNKDVFDENLEPI